MAVENHIMHFVLLKFNAITVKKRQKAFMTSSHPKASKSAYGAFSNEIASARKEDVHALLTIYVNLCISEMKSVWLNVISWRTLACIKYLLQI